MSDGDAEVGTLRQIARNYYEPFKEDWDEAPEPADPPEPDASAEPTRDGDPSPAQQGSGGTASAKWLLVTIFRFVMAVWFLVGLVAIAMGDFFSAAIALPLPTLYFGWYLFIGFVSG